MDTGKKSSQWLMLGGLFVGLLTVVAHGRGRWGQFIEWDDPTHVTQNIAIRALTLEHWRMMFTTAIAKLYVPLTWLSLAVDYQIWGRDPYGYHLTNLILHVANTLLVLVLVRRLLAGRHPHPVGVAVLSAAIFGVHPLRVESVAWVTESAGAGRLSPLGRYKKAVGVLVLFGRLHRRDACQIDGSHLTRGVVAGGSLLGPAVCLARKDSILAGEPGGGSRHDFGPGRRDRSNLVHSVGDTELGPSWVGQLLRAVLRPKIFLAAPLDGNLSDI